MIARLKGVVDAIDEASAVIDVHGVGYLVSCSAKTLGKLGNVGQPAQLWVETQVREDAIQLYGFTESYERDWFRILIGVQGVGGRVALALLSALTPEELSLAIAAGDRASLSRAQGVGPKLAARLVTELKDKAMVTAPPLAAATAAVVKEGSMTSEAVSALVNLGYRPVEAAAAVARARAELGESAATAALVRAGLRDLGRERTS